MGVTLTPQRSPVPGTALAMTPEGRCNPNYRVFITSPDEEKEEQTLTQSVASALGSPDPVLSPSRTKSPRDLGVTAPVAATSGSPASVSLPLLQASSPVARSRNPGQDPGPRTSTKESAEKEKEEDNRPYKQTLEPLLAAMVRPAPTVWLQMLLPLST